ncbi:MAG TPA: hypothetical protein PK306_05065 [Aquabacterium sp.]|nr:hypothetical protein [Aquabacterium sp.]
MQQFLIEPYSTVGFISLLLFAVALAATCILAVVGRTEFHSIALLVCVLAPPFLVWGISRIAGTPLLEAFNQAICNQGVGMCFPQAASFLFILPVLAAVTAISLVAAVRIQARQSGA